MVLLLNGELSDGNPNKRALESDYNCSSLDGAQKFKPRKISAIRDFPPGCGPDPQKISSELHQIANVVADERDKLESFEAVGSPLRSDMVVPHSDTPCIAMEGNGEIVVATQTNTVIEANDFKKPAEMDHQEVLDVAVTNDILMVEKADDKKISAEPEPEPDIRSDEVYGNPLDMEDNMVLDDVVGKVVGVVIYGMDSQFEEKVSDVRPVDMKFPEVQERTSVELSEESNGNETVNLLKLMDNVDSLATINNVPKDVIPYSETDVLAAEKVCLKDEAFPCTKDKFPRRRVSAIREFPIYCGRNFPPLVEEEQLGMGGGDKSVTGIENSREAVVSFAGEKQENIEGGNAEGRDGRFSPFEKTSSVGMVANKHLDNKLSIGKEIVIYEPFRLKPSNDTSSSGRCKEPAVVNATPLSSWKQRGVASSSEGVNPGGSANKLIPVRPKKFKTVAKKSTGKAGSLGRPFLKRDYVSICKDDETPGLPAVRGEKEHEDLASGCTLDIDMTLTPYVSNSCPGDARTKVRETRQLFQTICRKLLQVEEAKTKPDLRRIDLEAVKIMKSKGVDAGGKKYLGAVPGVEVGDEFQYRVELAIVGVHRLYQAGIDYMKENKMLVAISIVSSGGYANDREDEDSLIYCGQGGNVVGKDKKPEDQKLERGNLALKNSITTKNPVRVIHGFKENKSSDLADSKNKMGTIYVYDGLYTVESYWQEKGKYGNLVYMFKLKKIAGQPELIRKEVKKSNKPKLMPSSNHG